MVLFGKVMAAVPSLLSAGSGCHVPRDVITSKGVKIKSPGGDGVHTV